jgi:hypothetical protein
VYKVDQPKNLKAPTKERKAEKFLEFIQKSVPPAHSEPPPISIKKFLPRDILPVILAPGYYIFWEFCHVLNLYLHTLI